MQEPGTRTQEGKEGWDGLGWVGLVPDEESWERGGEAVMLVSSIIVKINE